MMDDPTMDMVRRALASFDEQRGGGLSIRARLPDGSVIEYRGCKVVDEWSQKRSQSTQLGDLKSSQPIDI